MSSKNLRLQLVLDTLDKASAPLKKISGSSDKAAKALKASKDQLKKLKKQQDDIASFEKLTNKTKESARALAKAQQRTADLAKQLKNTANPTKKLQREFEAAKRAANKLKTSHSENQKKLHELGNTLREAGFNTSRLSRYQAKLQRDIKTANNEIDKQKQKLSDIAKYQAKLNNLRKRGMVVGAHGAAGAFAGQQALSGMFGMLQPGISFGEQMSAVQAVTRLEKDDPRFQMLKEQAKQLGRATSFNSTQVAGGQEFLARAGFTPEAISSSMGDILALAKANRVELSRSADIVSNIAGTFRIDPEAEGNVTRLADLLTATSTRANVNLEMLGETMKHLGQAEGLNLSLEQAAAMAGLLGNIGIQGSEAGTTLRAMLTRLAAPTGEAQKAIKELGLEVTDSYGDLRQIPDILADIHDATNTMGNAQRAAYLKEIFGEEPGSGMAQLIEQQGKAGINKLVDILKNVQGENQKTADTMGDNVAGDLKSLRSAWEGISNVLTETNKGPLRSTIQTLRDMVRGIGDWMEQNPEITAGLVIFAAVLATVVTVLGVIGIAAGGAMMGIAALGKALPAVIGLFKGISGVLLAIGTKTIPLLLGGLKTLTLFMLTNPIGLVLTAIAAAAALIYYNWDKVSAYFSAVWTEIKTAFDGGLLGITSLLINWSPIGAIYNAIREGLALLGIELPTKFTEFGGMMIDGLTSGIKAKLGALKDTVVGAASEASNWFKDKLGIRSPSRVFISHGSDVMAGLEKGLGQNKNTLKPVMAVGKRLKQAGAGMALSAVAMNAPALDTRPPLQAGPAAGSGNSVHIGEIHVHAAPGMDEQALARLVAAEIAKIQMKQAANRRSRLTDED